MADASGINIATLSGIFLAMTFQQVKLDVLEKYKLLSEARILYER